MFPTVNTNVTQVYTVHTALDVVFVFVRGMMFELLLLGLRGKLSQQSRYNIFFLNTGVFLNGFYNSKLFTTMLYYFVIFLSHDKQNWAQYLGVLANRGFSGIFKVHRSTSVGASGEITSYNIVVI